MRLMIFTQKVDKHDPVLGFFHAWLSEFARLAESVIVVCLEAGEHELPSNVRVYSLGKEKGGGRFTYVSRFYRYAWRERNNYDAVFVHMNPEYIVLGSWLFFALRKPVYLWYVHREVDKKLRFAVAFARKVFTSTRESLRIPTRKAVYLGHGIDTASLRMSRADDKGEVALLHLGRITRIKHLETFVLAVPFLKKANLPARVLFVGAPVTDDDEAYAKELRALVEKEQVSELVAWAGPLPTRQALEQATYCLNGAPTGGMDKAVLESLAAGRPVFVANEAFRGVLGEYWDFFSYKEGDAAGLAEKITLYRNLPQGQKEVLLERLEEKVRLEYDVRTLIRRIMETINESA